MSVTRLVIHPNASMSPSLAVVAMAVAAVPLLGVTLALTALGLWPMLFFGIAPLLFFALVLRKALRDNHDREVISVEPRVIRIEHGTEGIGPRSATELNRNWLRVSVDDGPYVTSPTQLILRSMGRSIEVGRCLTDTEREQLASRLRMLTGSAWVSVRRHEVVTGVCNE